MKIQGSGELLIYFFEVEKNGMVANDIYDVVSPGKFLSYMSNITCIIK